MAYRLVQTTRSPSPLPNSLSPMLMVATGWAATLASRAIAVMQHAAVAVVDGVVVVVAAAAVAAAAEAAAAEEGGKTEEPSNFAMSNFEMYG